MTYKEKFLASGAKQDFEKIVALPAFSVACDYALLILTDELPQTLSPNLMVDPTVSVNANSQLQGAKRMIEILSHLHEPIEPPKHTLPKTPYRI